MARRKAKKERKKYLKEDHFRDSMLTAGKQVKEYRYLILLSAAVIVLLVVLLAMRTRRREEQLANATEIIKRGAAVGPEELKQLSLKVKDEPIEPWILLRYGNKLYELYLKEDALKNDKVRLQEAKKVFADVISRFPDNGSAVFLAKKALETVERELSYEPPEALRKAFERATSRDSASARPKKKKEIVGENTAFRQTRHHEKARRAGTSCKA